MVNPDKYDWLIWWSMGFITAVGLFVVLTAIL